MSQTSEPASPDFDPETPAATATTLATDAARIGAEFVRVDGGTDPFAAAVRATMMPMVVSDPRQPDNPIVFVNDSFCELSGYSRADIVGRNCRFLQGPETDRATVGRIRTAIATRQAIEIDILNYRKDGVTFWNRLRMAPVYDAAGQIAYYFASQVDVTLERELLNELRSSNLALLAENAGRALELADSEARLALAIEAGRLGVFEHDLTNEDMVVSARMREHFGHPTDASFTVAHLRAAVHPDDLPRLLERLERALAGEPELDVEYRVVRPSGTMVWLRVRALILRDPAGRPTRMVGTSADVTAEVEAAAAQRMLTELLELRVAERTRERDRLWQGSRDLLLVLDGGGVMLAVNPAWTRLLGWAEDELAGRTFADFVHPEDVAASLRALDSAAERTLPQLYNRCRHADGSYRWVEWTASPVDGHVTAIGRDVTAEREAARRLQATEETLRQSQKMEAVGQLTGGIAHDFNNLLTGMLGAIELVEARLAQGRVDGLARYVASARQSAERAAALTNRLLSFSRRQAVQLQPVRCDQLVAGMEELIRRTMGSRIEFAIHVPADLWTTLCDANQLENALLNLCINARDAMPDGGRLTIAGRNRRVEADADEVADLAPGDYISLSVVDTGVGMAPEVVARAFDPFFTTKPIGQGTGLGLSMTYGFARQSGGHAAISSRAGNGTTIVLVLPRHVEAASAAVDLPAPLPGRAPVRGTVLVVEDEAAIRDIILDVLSERGIATLHAADGAAAVALIRSGAAIDVLLSDIGLPGDINGRQLAAIVRRERPKARVLLMTGYAEPADPAAEQAPPVLAKPFAMEMLADRVAAMLTAGT